LQKNPIFRFRRMGFLLAFWHIPQDSESHGKESACRTMPSHSAFACFCRLDRLRRLNPKIMRCSTDKLAIRKESPRIAYPLILAIPVCLLGNLAFMSCFAPVAEEYSLFTISNFFYGFLSGICHQYPTRCLWILNRPMALCSRCFSVYASLTICLLCLPLIRGRKFIVLSTLLFIPLVVDGLLQFGGIAASDHFRRGLTGVLFGAAASVLYKRSAFTLLNNIGVESGRTTANHFRRNLNFVFSAGVLLLTIAYSFGVYLL
jgi:uncharacterized membrane protein